MSLRRRGKHLGAGHELGEVLDGVLECRGEEGSTFQNDWQPEGDHRIGHDREIGRR